MEEVRWDDEGSTIIMHSDMYYEHIKLHLKDMELINNPIQNYVQMKLIYGGRIPAAPITLIAIHHALSHLMDHASHAIMYLGMTPKGRLSWFTTFLKKYYL